MLKPKDYVLNRNDAHELSQYHHCVVTPRRLAFDLSETSEEYQYSLSCLLDRIVNYDTLLAQG